MNLTKCWKYLTHNKTNNDNFNPLSSYSSSSTSSSYDDLNIEIYLNKPIQIGCVQLKIKFIKRLSVSSNYELRLFRQNKKSFNEKLNAVDIGIDFK
jgi:hypothetical protein